MKKSEFVPGVLFHMPGHNRYQVFKVESLDPRIIARAGHTHLNGKFFEYKSPERWHFISSNRGIKLWTVADTVYLYSKTIPFEHLTKVELPAPTEPATQSQTI